MATLNELERLPQARVSGAYLSPPAARRGAAGRASRQSFGGTRMSADIARPALTRAQRRRLRKIADRVDLVTQADRAFFLRRPERQHRVRISHLAEIEQLRIVSGKPLAVP